MRKILEGLLMVLIIVSLSSNIANASDISSPSGNRNIDQIFCVTKDISGVTANSIDELTDLNTAVKSTIILKQISISRLNEQYVVKCKMNLGKTIVDYNFYGSLYKKIHTDNFTSYGDLILGELSDFNNFHIVQFKVDKKTSSICLVLQESNSMKLYQFKIPITTDEFSSLYNHINNSLTDKLLEEKIVSLYSLRHNLINSPKDNDNTFSYTIKNNDVSQYSFAGWKKLISDLNSKGSVKLSNYSGIQSSWFKGGGWHDENIWGTAPYSVSIYSSANGSYEYISQFTMIDAISQSYDDGSKEGFKIRNLSLQTTYLGGMMVSYNKLSDILSVQIRGLGVKISNMEVAIKNLPPEAFFIKRYVDANGEKKGDINILRAAIGLYKPADTFVSIFDKLQSQVDQKIKTTYTFEQTYEGQWAKYGGKVIRAIGVKDTTRYLTAPGHYDLIEGKALYIEGTSCTCEYEYQYTATHNL